MKNKAIPLQRSLLFNLAAGVVLLGAILLSISLIVTDRAVARLSGALTNRIIATTDAELLSFFEPVQAAIEVTAARVFEGDFEEFPLDAMDRYYVPLIESMPQLSSVMYAHADGDEYMLLQTAGGWQSRRTRPDTWGQQELWRQWRGESEKDVEQRPVDYDARRRPWFIGAMQRLERLGPDVPLRELISWTEPYKFFTTQEPGVTASLAFRAADGRTVVLGFDILLSDVSRFTSRITISERGKAFVMRGEPRSPDEMVVIGLPSDERFSDESAMLEFVLSPPYGLGGPVASFVSSAMAGSADPVGAAVRFEHAGEPWWGEFARSQLETADDIWIGAVIPEAELLEGQLNASLIVIVATGLVLLLAVLRAMRLSRRYATPLEELTDRGNRMQRLNFEPVDPVESDIAEIRHLSATLERMRAALQTFSAAREDLRVAQAIHSMGLPDRLPEVDGLELSVWHQASELVGGESYDAVLERGRADVLVAVMFDLPGSGLQAAVGGNLLRIVFRAAVREGCGLREVAERLDDFVRSDHPELEGLRFWLLRVDASRRELSALGLGFGPLLYRRRDGVEQIDCAPGMLGMSPPDALPDSVDRALGPGDLLVVATDGIFDELDGERHRFGSEGIRRALARLAAGVTVAEVIDRVSEDLAAHGSDGSGDRTLLVIRLGESGDGSD